ncbi:MAG: hypothetical protein ACO1SV_02070 [Fimbriimonas sp.]
MQSGCHGVLIVWIFAALPGIWNLLRYVFADGHRTAIKDFAGALTLPFAYLSVALLLHPQPARGSEDVGGLWIWLVFLNLLHRGLAALWEALTLHWRKEAGTHDELSPGLRIVIVLFGVGLALLWIRARS